MTHLIVCREYPPAPYPPGGIGTYVRHIARLLAEAGEVVHVVAQRWEGAPAKVTESCDGKLIVHRVSLDEPVNPGAGRGTGDARLLDGLTTSDCPSQAFSWQASRLAEFLAEAEPIDVIEGPEWEAPLYYLQVRRALGLGPRRRPPCLIHLHSPSRLIFQHNEWDYTLTDFLPLVRFEEYTVRAADSLVCPSRYLARQAERLFALAEGDVAVIPYPRGDTPEIERTAETWARDSICYVGRLELRKGIVEWVDAAVRVAQSHATVTFDFFGSDTSLNGGAGRSVREILDDRIPRPLRPRFRFYGSQSHSRLHTALAGVSVAVIPSRWENLPYTCIEAMSTGLPVLVSPHGGMAELAADGQSGWVATDASAAALESALRRFLATPPPERAAMGRRAAQAVRRICGNESVLRRHLELRSRLADQGATRSWLVPPSASLQAAKEPPVPKDKIVAAGDRSGIGLVVTCLDHPELMAECMKSIRRQNRPPHSVVVVVAAQHRLGAELAGRAQTEGWTVVYTSHSSPAEARNLGAVRLLTAAPRLLGVAFLNEYARLEPHYVSACESVFGGQSGVGLVSSWIRYENHRHELQVGPAPALPAAGDDTSSYAAIRTEALIRGPAGEPPARPSEILAGGGFASVTYPDVLVSVCSTESGNRERMGQKKRYSVMALGLRSSANIGLEWFIAAPLREKMNCLGRGLMQPRRVAQWIAWQARSVAGKAFAPR